MELHWKAKYSVLVFPCCERFLWGIKTMGNTLPQSCGCEMKGEIIMGFKSDIEIAQECTMSPITEIAAKAGIDDKYLEQYGKYKAKIC